MLASDQPTAALTAITVSPTITTVDVGQSRTLTATGRYADGSTRDVSQQVEWTTSDPRIARVEPDGQATAVAAGTGEVTASLDDRQGSALLTVPRLTALAVSSTTATVAVGQSRTFSARGRYDDGTTRDVSRLVEWVSSEPQVATVDPDGRATALAAGAGEITARLDDQQDSVLLTVPRLTALAVSPTTATVAVRQSRTFTATGRYDDGSTRDVSELVEWVSSDPRVATVDPDGRATALAAGAGEITARLDDEQDSALLTVGR